MTALFLPKELVKMLDFIEGETTERKVVNLVNGNASSKLKECEGEIVKFETKYGMTFEDFEINWTKKKIPDRHSHEVERDYMEWEGFEKEKQHWLKAIRKIRIEFFAGNGQTCAM